MKKEEIAFEMKKRWEARLDRMGTFQQAHIVAIETMFEVASELLEKKLGEPQ